MTSKKKKLSGHSLPTRPSAVQTVLTSVESNSEKQANISPLTPQSSTGSASLETDETQSIVEPSSPSDTQQPWLSIFPQNVAAPMLTTALSPPGTRFESTLQLAYCNKLLRMYLSPSKIAPDVSLDYSQRALIDSYIQDEEGRNKISWLTIRVVEIFVAGSFRSLNTISEVVLLGPSLDQAYYRKLLDHMTAEVESTELLDMIQGLTQLVECAAPFYLLPGDLTRILAILRTRLQSTHQQTTMHHYYLILALSRLLDVVVEGKIQDPNRIVDYEPLSALLIALSKNPDPYLKHQATYALQGLLH
ncbi:hypothetical protein BGX23_003352, partial [Mortierella sp. AD031]